MRLPEPEVIGHKDCPLFHRWTLLTWGDGAKLSSSYKRYADAGDGEPSRGGKLLLHHFFGNADDRSVHDHPRPFWTFVLWGGYDDMAPCPVCDGCLRVEDPALVELYEAKQAMGQKEYDAGLVLTRAMCWKPCPTCRVPEHGPLGVVLRERMRRGMLRYRPAEHRHRTRVHAGGCWTLVWMGPLTRQWGFWVAGKWIGFRDYEERYGPAMRCD